MRGPTTRAMRGPTRKLVVLGTVASVCAGWMVGVEGLGTTADALTPPVAITADELPTWQTNGVVYAMAEANGVVYAGGTFSTVRPPGAASGTQEETVANFVALDAATGEPVDCDLKFTIGSGTASVRALAVSPDEKTLYVGGSFGSVNGSSASSLAAFDIPSCERTSFPATANGIVRDIAATDNNVYLAGDFTKIRDAAKRRFAAVSPTGAVKERWTADADEIGKAVAVTPDGKNVIVGGDFFTVNGTDSHALAVVSASNGDLVKDYPLGFIEAASTVQDIAVDATGFYTGNEGSGGGVFDGRIALDLDTFEERWRDTCLGATQGVLPYKDVLYSAHHAHDCSSIGEFPNQERFHLFGQSTKDRTLLGWFPNTNDGLGERLGPRVLALSDDHPSDDRDFLWAGGGFTTVNGKAQWGLTRFATEPDTGDPTVPEAHVTGDSPGQLDVTWRSSLDLDDSQLTYDVYRDGGKEPVHTVEGSSVPWRRPQLTFVDKDVKAGESYSYRITATDAAGNVSKQSEAVSATVASGADAEGTQPQLDDTDTPSEGGTTTAASYAAAVKADKPLLYWRFDEKANNFASDSSGNNSNGVHRGGPQRGVTPPALAGEGAAAIGYDGEDSYTYSERSYSGLTQYTLETWFRTTTTTGGRLIGFSNRTLQPSTQTDNTVYMLDDGRVVFGLYNGRYRTTTSEEALNDGKWHHLVASVGKSGMRLYVDGSVVDAYDAVTAGRDLTGYWRTGGDRLDYWPSRPTSDYFAGEMDETAVYEGELSATRVTAHHDAAGATTSDSANETDNPEDNPEDNPGDGTSEDDTSEDDGGLIGLLSGRRD